MKTREHNHRQIQNLFSVLSDALMDLGVLRTINILQLGRKGRLNESEIHLVSVSVSEIFSVLAFHFTGSKICENPLVKTKKAKNVKSNFFIILGLFVSYFLCCYRF